jgi:hypothetical protein
MCNPYPVVSTDKRIQTAVSDRFIESNIQGITSLSQCRQKCFFRRLLPRPKDVLLVILLILISGCTSLQTQENTLEQIATIRNIRYNQLLTNISLAIDQTDPVPPQGVENSGTATTSATGGLSATVTEAVGLAFNPFSLARSTKAFTPTASINWQNNWSITPVSDPQDLQNLRALYGLIYRTDAQIADFIEDTMKIQSASTILPIPMEYLVGTWAPQKCGISLNPPAIQNPEDAMAAYLSALKAFPEAQKQNVTDNKEKTTKPKQLVTNKNQKQLLTTKCYGDVSTTGLDNDSLAAQYGLLYPTMHDVFVAVRNGLSPACRHYQLENMFVSGENGTINGNILFTRWLFWRARDGSWAPSKPPSEPQYLGNYGGRDFWTTSPACIDDFILITINATANSHAAAQTAPKATTTPAIQQ